MACSAPRRLENELKAWRRGPPVENVEILEISEDLRRWRLRLSGAEGTIYSNEVYTLLVSVSSGYPLEPPTFVFSPESVPVHPHVYSCGHICLSLLAEDWSPALTIQSVALSLLSMLSSAKIKERPPDDESYSKRAAGRDPKKTVWAFHDETC